MFLVFWGGGAVIPNFFRTNIVHVYYAIPDKKTDSSILQLENHVRDSPNNDLKEKKKILQLGNHVGDPPNNDLKKKKFLQQNEIRITQRHLTSMRK